MASTCLPLLCGSTDDPDAQKQLPEQEEISSHGQSLRSVFDTWDTDHDGFLTAEELCDSMQRLGLQITKQGLKKIIADSGIRVTDGGLDFDGFRALEETLDSTMTKKKSLLSSEGNLMKDVNGVKDNHNNNNNNNTAKQLHGLQDPKNPNNNNNNFNGDVVHKVRSPLTLVVDLDDDEDDEDNDLHKAFGVFDKNGDGLISPIELQSTLSDLGLLSTTMSLRCIHSMIRRVDSNQDGFVDYDEFKSMLKHNP